MQTPSSLDELAQPCFISPLHLIHSAPPINLRSPAASHYRIVYAFHMPGKPFIDEYAEFFLDLQGGLIPAAGLRGIPNCQVDSAECAFPIDSTQARAIAHDAGLASGIADWQMSFHWFDGTWQTYVWTVSNALTPSNGRTVVIDANNGVVLEVTAWKHLAKTP